MDTKNMTDIVESTMKRIGVVAEYSGKRSEMFPYINKVRTSLMMTKCRFEGWSLLNVLDGRPTDVTRYKPITDADDDTQHGLQDVSVLMLKFCPAR